MIKDILIVDDEPHILMLMKQTLEEFEESIHIHTAENGREALDFIQKNKPDLVFLDVMLPYISGLEICKQVKADPQLSQIYVVLLSARAQNSDRFSGESVSADLYITKPFDPDQIVEVVEQLQSNT